MKFNTILLILISFALFISCINRSESINDAVSKKPNIVLFFVDDLGWSDLGFRNNVFETPNIDQLAKESLSFEQAYVASPTCSPSRATLMTGKHPARLKMVRHIPGGGKDFDKYGRTTQEFNLLPTDPAQFPSRNWLPLEHETYAEALKKQGYYNIFVGKWHLGHEEYHPIKQGFDKQVGTTNRGMPKSYYHPYFLDSDVYKEETEAYLTDKLSDEAVDFIDSYDKKQPFMLTFSYHSVHTPHIGPNDFTKYFLDKGLEKNYANYAAMVKSMDMSVGRVLEAIKKHGIEDETIIIFTSDQGGYFENKPFKGEKMKGLALYEGGARVPFLVKWNGVTKDGGLIETPVQTTDIFPTLVEIAGGKVSDHKDLDGISLLQAIKKGELQEERTLFAYRAYEDLYVSVRSGDWKLMTYRSGKQELYNIKNDFKEQHDLVAKHPDKVKELTSKLVEWEEKMGVQKYSGIK